MRLFILICVVTIFSSPAFSAEHSQQSTLSENWINRPSPETPATDEETLAVLAASEKRIIIKKNMTATYDGIHEDYETVTVATTPESESDLQTIVRYSIRDGQIYAVTRPTYKSWAPPGKDSPEQTARQAAVNANGVSTLKPELYGDKMLTIIFNGTCSATVTEKNFDHEVLAEYRFNMCE